MEKPVLNDKDQFPAKEIIASHLGKNIWLWDSFFDYIQTSYPDFIPEWRYYKDGGSWLMKIQRKKKTVCWVSIIEDAFRVTFYFPDRAEEPILESGISAELKDQFKNGKHYGKIRGLTIIVTQQTDLEYIQEIIGIKLKIK